MLSFKPAFSASWLSSHGRGLGPRDALKKDSRGLCRGAAGNPRVIIMAMEEYVKGALLAKGREGLLQDSEVLHLVLDALPI